ncbi:MULTISPECIES: DUF6660 family protein [Flagellimonas]|uniref:DUF6660 family protein n=2 Tax=Flagellimonas TaxID=444459 RepID=A0AAU7MWE6_9FLAO|nr:DUF6660 family protein [[Muricauda] okinawensis]MDF0706270.1 hypothetical protein [[Muricauda] okinawensis]
MKFFTVILSIYVLALNVVPCSDAGNVTEDSQGVYLVQFDGEHSENCELCSPFCHCHCCHVHTVDFGIARFQPLQETYLEEVFTHFEGLGKEFTDPLFQPPQV